MNELDKIEKSMKNIIYKATAPVGTIREWADGKHKKVSDGSWEKVSESEKESKKEVFNIIKPSKMSDIELDFPAEGSKEWEKDKAKAKEKKENAAKERELEFNEKNKKKKN